MQSRHLLPQLLALFLPLFGLGQSLGDLSLEYQEGGSIEAEFWVQQAFGKTLELDLFQANIREVRLSQGRLKDSLSYTYDFEKLRVSLPDNLDPRSRIYIRYSYSLETIQNSPFFELLKPGIVFNLYNLEEGARSGVPGWLIPANQTPYQELKLGLLFPQDLKPGLPLEEDYAIELKDRRKLVYFYNEDALDLAAFYLVLGEFRRFDPEDFLEDLEEKEDFLRRGKLALFQEKYSRLLDFVAANKSLIWTDEQLENLMALEVLPDPPTFLSAESLETKYVSSHRAMQNAILASHYTGKELSDQFHQFWKATLGPQAWQENLDLALERGDTSVLFWDYYSQWQLAQRDLVWQDSINVQKSEVERHYISILAAAQKRKAPLALKVSYRLKAQESRLYFYLSQPDTSLRFSSSLKGEMLFKDEVKSFSTNFSLGEADTVFIDLEKSPLSLYLEPRENALLSFEEIGRPINYLLYDLSKAPSAEKRRSALLSLLEKAGPNLMATVVGIALDSGDPQLQQLALDKVKDLRPGGRARLESTLKAMALEQSNVKLMQKAKRIVEEYWPQ